MRRHLSRASDHVHVLLEESSVGAVSDADAFMTTMAVWHGIVRVPPYNSII